MHRLWKSEGNKYVFYIVLHCRNLPIVLDVPSLIELCEIGIGNIPWIKTARKTCGKKCQDSLTPTHNPISNLQSSCKEKN
jgi:hypothetical protein